VAEISPAIRYNSGFGVNLSIVGFYLRDVGGWLLMCCCVAAGCFVYAGWLAATVAWTLSQGGRIFAGPLQPWFQQQKEKFSMYSFMSVIEYANIWFPAISGTYHHNLE